jgi:DNA-binding IclR family transcriptional regulator
MRRLALQAGQSCHLTILSGARVVVVARQDSFRDRSFAMRVGAESPLLNSCSGRIFFALADNPTRETMLQCIKDLGEETDAVQTIEDVSAALREQSCYEMPSSQVAGIVDIGTPVIDHDGTIAASLVIPFLHRIDKNNDSDLSMVKRYLVNSAKEISAALGATVS